MYLFDAEPSNGTAAIGDRCQKSHEKGLQDQKVASVTCDCGKFERSAPLFPSKNRVITPAKRYSKKVMLSNFSNVAPSPRKKKYQNNVGYLNDSHAKKKKKKREEWEKMRVTELE